jgi:hypothetical protein
MKISLCYLRAISALALAACADKPAATPGHKLVLQTIHRPNRPDTYLYREVPDPAAR